MEPFPPRPLMTYIHANLILPPHDPNTTIPTISNQPSYLTSVEGRPLCVCVLATLTRVVKRISRESPVSGTLARVETHWRAYEKRETTCLAPLVITLERQVYSPQLH